MAGDRDKSVLLRCSFCGKSQEEVKKLVAGPTVYICNECVALCNDILREEEKTEVPKAGAPKTRLTIPRPAEIKEVLDQYVIGQEKAKRILSVAVHNHYKRLTVKTGPQDVELQKSNVLLVGPTGVGKTLLAQTLARILEQDQPNQELEEHVHVLLAPEFQLRPLGDWEVLDDRDVDVALIRPAQDVSSTVPEIAHGGGGRKTSGIKVIKQPGFDAAAPCRIAPRNGVGARLHEGRGIGQNREWRAALQCQNAGQFPAVYRLAGECCKRLCRTSASPSARSQATARRSWSRPAQDRRCP